LMMAVTKNMKMKKIMMKTVAVLMMKKDGVGYLLYIYIRKDSTIWYILCIVVPG
jgi:hypothetical protein